jgi:hypothetical protein
MQRKIPRGICWVVENSENGVKRGDFVFSTPTQHNHIVLTVSPNCSHRLTKLFSPTHQIVLTDSPVFSPSHQIVLNIPPYLTIILTNAPNRSHQISLRHQYGFLVIFPLTASKIINSFSSIQYNSIIQFNIIINYLFIFVVLVVGTERVVGKVSEKWRLGF